MRPGSIEEDVNKQEETLLARSWLELFPNNAIPNVLAQPCCAQFAISRDRIRSLPLARYVCFRDWLLRTSLSDYISGRVWEYMWQYIFTGENVLCPKEHVCYCDGFGVCFAGEEEYEAYWVKNRERVGLERELQEWREENEKMKRVPKEEWSQEMIARFANSIGGDLELEGKIKGLLAWAENRRRLAKEWGDDPKHRAVEAGREWKEGDGF